MVARRDGARACDGCSPPQTAERLATVDPIRTKYWERRLADLRQKHGLPLPESPLSDPVEVEEIPPTPEVPARAPAPPPPPESDS